jgi:hypothetical protein
MSKFKFLFKVSLFSLLVTITTPTPAEAVKLVRQDGDQGHCQAFVPEGAYIQELVGKANSDKLSAEFGDTKSYLEGRNSKFYINNHNGNPIVENRVCGLTQIDDLPRVKGLLITTPEHFRGEMVANLMMQASLLKTCQF